MVNTLKNDENNNHNHAELDIVEDNMEYQVSLDQYCTFHQVVTLGQMKLKWAAVLPYYGSDDENIPSGWMRIYRIHLFQRMDSSCRLMKASGTILVLKTSRSRIILMSCVSLIIDMSFIRRGDL